MGEKYDFSGWATKNDLLCSDGVVIRRDAFKDQDGARVPIVWMHNHNDPTNVLGHADLENRPEGVYAYGKFNNTEAGQHAKALVEHGDISYLSIWANKLKKQSNNVMHGTIREVSLVYAGANPGAYIEYPQLAHGEQLDDDMISDAYIYTGEFIEQADKEEPEKVEEVKEDKNQKGKEEMPENSGKTVKDVFDELTEEQKKVVYFMIGKAIEDAKGSKANNNDEEDEEVKHNVFDNESYNEPYLSHDDMMVIFNDAKKSGGFGSLKESFLAHAEDYGIDGIEWLFPDPKELNNKPDFISRDQEWVNVVMNGVSKSPFSRIKTSFADITEDEARAKGYLKAHQKKNEVFTLLKRSTTPQTIYKLQKLDRDDVIDITDFDVVAYIKGEMRLMLNEEIARAILIGDGRDSASDDKISEDHVRPVATDASLFTIYVPVVTASGASDEVKAKALIRSAVKSRKDYKGSGNITFFTTEDWLTEMLLLTDEMGRDLYESVEKLATKMRVKRIVTCEVMENQQVRGADLMGVALDLSDYKVGSDKGGAINMFDDFDIDFNQMKYLIETRISGALVKPYAAMVFTDGTPTTDSDTHGVLSSKTTYTEVTPESGDNPSEEGWYEKNASGKYVLTSDTTVTSGKTYYVRYSAV